MGVPAIHSHWGDWTTPLKQTGLPALYNSSIMLGLCPFQSSTLVLLLHNRCRLKLLFWFIVSSVPKAHLFLYLPSLLTLWMIFSKCTQQTCSLLFYVVQWKHGLVSVHLCVCVCVCAATCLKGHRVFLWEMTLLCLCPDLLTVMWVRQIFS